MKQVRMLAVAATVVLAPTLAMALTPPEASGLRSRPAGSVIDVILDRGTSAGTRESDAEWRDDGSRHDKDAKKASKDALKQQKKREKEFRKAAHQREKDLRKASHEREKDLHEAAREREKEQREWTREQRKDQREASRDRRRD